MATVGALEAQDNFGHFLALAERGEEVTITRHGKPIARIVPAGHTAGHENARAAIQRMRERAEGLKLGRFEWAEWKAYRDEGRP